MKNEKHGPAQTFVIISNWGPSRFWTLFVNEMS